MTDDRLPWFPCYPSKLLGALSAMKPHEGYVYWIVCLRIYEVNGPCPDTLEAICRRTGYNRRQVSNALDSLFRSKKLARVPSGITNPFAESVIAATKDHRDRLVEAGRTGGIRAGQNRRENQGDTTSQAKASPQRGHSKYTSTQTEELFPTGNRLDLENGENSDWPKDYREQFWSRFPRKTEKKAAMAKLEAIHKGGKVRWHVFVAGIGRYAAHVIGTEERYIKHPTTWLNRGCWDDEFSTTRPQHGPGHNGFAAVARNLMEQEQTR